MYNVCMHVHVVYVLEVAWEPRLVCTHYANVIILALHTLHNANLYLCFTYVHTLLRACQ